MRYAVLMAGGRGTRLWPISRQNHPKQLHPFIGEKPLVRETFERIDYLPPEQIFISTTPEYQETIQKMIPEVPSANYIIEPYAMGNAAACCLVTVQINRVDSDASIIFLPSDQDIRDDKRFTDLVQFGFSLVESHPEQIVTIGIEPTRPDTGFGYIEMSDKFEVKGDTEAYKVKRFVEKPDEEKAKEFLQSGNFKWNAGIFLWNSKTILNLYQKFLPNTLDVIKNITDHAGTDEYNQILERDYKLVDKTSIEYAIIEKTNDILIIPGEFGWSDVGSWLALFSILSKHEQTQIISRGNHMGVGDKNCLVMAGNKLIATIGLENIAIIDTPDVQLICNLDKSQEVKQIIETLKKEEKFQYL